MKGFGPVTLQQVETAIENIGGQAKWIDILEEITRLRNGDFSHYLNKENYEKSAFQIVQSHCPIYKKYRGITRFEKVGNEFRLTTKPGKTNKRPLPAKEMHTPQAIDINEPTQPERVLQETYRVLRDTGLSRMVKESHQYRCQICGQTLKLSDGKPYAEAHHIIPLGKPYNGPDVRSNILCVCPNDHVLLDYGAIKLKEDSLVGIDKDSIKYHNEKIYGKVLV